MRVFEHPTTATNPVPRRSIVVIRLDPLASVASLNDEQASREASTLGVKKVLAVYQRNIGLEYSHELNGFRIRAQFLLAGPGLPAAPLSAASLPISPATPLQDARAAVKTTPPLPRDDCYIHTLHSTLVVVSRIYQPGNIVGYCLSKEDDMHMELTRMADHGIHSDALAERYANELRDSQAGSVVGSRAEPSLDDSVSELASESGSGASGADFADDFLPQVRVVHADSDVPRQMEAQVELWTELLPDDDDLGTPDEFSDVIGRLYEIEHKYINRAMVEELAKKPQTNAWLSKISAGDEVPSTTHIKSGDQEVDGLVLPEDAIEHRIERGTLAQCDCVSCTPIMVDSDVTEAATGRIQTCERPPVSSAQAPSDHCDSDLATSPVPVFTERKVRVSVGARLLPFLASWIHKTFSSLAKLSK